MAWDGRLCQFGSSPRVRGTDFLTCSEEEEEEEEGEGEAAELAVGPRQGRIQRYRHLP